MKEKLLAKYKIAFKNIEEISLIDSSKLSIKNNWLITLLFNLSDISNMRLERDLLLDSSFKKKIMLRPVWKLLHKLPMYRDMPRGPLEIAEKYEYRLINLPSSPQLFK